MNKDNLLFIIGALVLGVIIGYSISPAQPREQAKDELPEEIVEKPQLTLPPEAQKISDCVPNMGEHWASPENLPFGPIYLVDKEKVIGIEYMIHEDELEKELITVGEEKMGKPAVMPVLEGDYDHIELQYLPEGHEGDEAPHYDLHMYLISQNEQEAICPKP